MNCELIVEATDEDVEVIDSGLVTFNESQVPFTQKPLSIDINYCIKDENGEVVAGIVSDVYCWKILGIEVLWVKPEFRNKGYASALLEFAENKAREMGCQLSHLDTFDFQAKEFYETRGYKVFGVLEDCPEGHNRHYMSKQL
jgi:GNAT superfamily N-acetyltransferase